MFRLGTFAEAGAPFVGLVLDDHVVPLARQSSSPAPCQRPFAG